MLWTQRGPMWGLSQVSQGSAARSAMPAAGRLDISGHRFGAARAASLGEALRRHSASDGDPRRLRAHIRALARSPSPPHMHALRRGGGPCRRGTHVSNSLRGCKGMAVQWWLLPSTLPVGVFVLLLPGRTLAVDLEQLVSPGPLVEGRADAESECSHCHRPFDRGPEGKLCLACHQALAADVEAREGLHGRLSPDEVQACRSCHSEH